MNNMASPITESDPVRAAQSDEIDLLGLFRSICRTWRHLFAAVIVVSVGYAGWVSLKVLVHKPSVNVNKAIKLTFVGVEKGIYPNGAPFQLADVIAPVIIQEVFERHNLLESGITVDEFRRSLNVEPYAPTYALIVDRYKMLLSNSKLTVPEVEALEKRLSAELAAAVSGAAMLTMSLDRFEVSPERAHQIVSDLPATWAQYSIANKGVLHLDIELASAKSIDRELINAVDYMVISDLLKEKTGLVETNIELLSEFDGAATLKDPDTGMGLADLKQALEDLRRYVIDDLMSPIRSLGLTRNRDLSLYYYEDKKQRLSEDIRLLQSQAELIRQAFEKYSSQPSPAGTNLPKDSGTFVGGGSAQLSAGALDKVLQMSSEGKAEEYRQELNRQWLETNLKAAGIQNQIDEVDRLIKALNGVGQSETSKVLRDEYLARAEHTLPKILDRISDYLDITQNIYQQVSRESVGINGKLYKPITNEPFIRAPYIDIKRTLLIWVALLFITAIIVVPTVMIRQALRNRSID
ncbi:hypothetical protein FKG94_06160 [Exilibacterium tricleocarpae]|uniref:Uncharacterized protein n=1 Tax=Exilibacterium tricleocarpae TaxID=2591008 RepID=A0A545U438_9GAMM|nr:hypothetical protein [Exilibacterium tricleocarpae]TQV84239.1 hypothetical protein FKG94_06160 [Exilibacterium tricleocarpae]